MNNIPDVRTEENWHTLDDGEKIYTKTWKTTGEPNARMIMVHGFSDHCNNFNLFFPLLAARGVEVFGFDQRGFGRSVKSKRQRGLTGPTSQIMADISSVIRRFLPSFPAQSATRPDHVPLFLTGHSMGGGEVIYHASKFPSSEIRGYLSMSPWITLSPGMAPSRLEVAAGRIAMRIMPHFQVVQPVKGDLLSHDPKVSENARFDELCHDTFTLEAADGCLSRGEEISSGKCVVRTADGVTSFWLGHGTEDGICAYSGAKHWFENYCEVDDKELKTYDGWFHVIHDEGPGEAKQRFADDVATWILARANP